MEIHQLLPGYQYGDAISNHAAGLRTLLRAWGYRSEIFSQYIGPAVEHDCFRMKDFRGRDGALTIYHYSIGAAEMTDLFLSAPGKRMLVYHNITPHHYFSGLDEEEFQKTKEGRDALVDLRGSADMVLADSQFNCDELAEIGFSNPRLLPILVDIAGFDAAQACARTLDRLRDGWTNLLFVGRLAPNKRQDDVIRVFAHYNEFINRRSRLLLVGSDAKQGYAAQLRGMVRQFGLGDYVEFPGHVRLAELKAYYQAAEVFICMSEHEGFCVPFLEAFHHGVPVVAYKAAAVPGTLGGAGILVGERNFSTVAELVNLLVTDDKLRTLVIRGQHRRLSSFEPRLVGEQFRAYLSEVIAA
jgi:glycosyltransferase involved in cell wall biosynthesis